MCRSIKVLRSPAGPPTTDELSAAALQFVRKISGYHKPSQANRAVFDQAVAEITEASRRLMQSLERPERRTAERPESSGVLPA